MNWNILGHNWAVNLLKGHVASDTVRHAYLITGPQGVGRRTLALRLAQALNCTQPIAPGEPCGTCLTCQQIDRMQYPDLEVIQAEQRGGTLKIEQVRDLQRRISLAPYQGRYRVALLLFFEEANLNAANALLKTLEEPPGQVVIILTAESADLLLPTIVSRCEIIRLRPLPVDILGQGLQERWGVPVEQARLLASISAGRPGVAWQLYQNPTQIELRKQWMNDHQSLLESPLRERFRYAENVSKDKEATRNLLLTWLLIWRDVLLKASGTHTPILNLDHQQEIEQLSQNTGVAQSHAILTRIEQTLVLLEKNINTRLALEVLMLDLPQIQTKNVGDYATS